MDMPLVSRAPPDAPADQSDMSIPVAHSRKSSAVELTSEPQAVSTAIRPRPLVNKRLQELLASFTEQFSMSLASASTTDADLQRESSFGLVPKHLVDLSMSFLNNADRSAANANAVAAADKLSDDVFEDDVFEKPLAMDSKLHGANGTCERQAGDGKEEMSVTKSKVDSLQEQSRNNAEDLKQVEFRVEQISARSSTVDSYRGSAGDRVSALGEELLAKLFQRHSLDLSAVASSPFDPFLRARSEQTSAPTFTAAESKSKTPQSADEIKENILDSRFLKEGLSTYSTDFEIRSGADDGSFVAAEDAMGLFEKDEEAFKMDHAFEIPNQVDDFQSSAMRQSWLQNPQDITRPSWFGAADDSLSSRISIGAFLRAKTEELGTLEGSVAEFESRSPPREFEPLSAMQFVDVEDVCDASTMSVLNCISRLHNDTSNTFDPDAMMERVLKFTKDREANKRSSIRRDSSRTTVRADPSGASDMTDHSELPLTAPDNVGVAPVGDWVALRRVKKLDREDSKSSIPGGLPHEHQQNVMDVTEGHLGNVSQWNGTVNQPVSQTFPGPPVTLHLLHKSSSKRRPSLAVPTNLIFSEPCVTGISSTQRLELWNPSSLWLEGSAELLSLKCNGIPQNVCDPAASRVFTFDPRFTVGPESCRRVAVNFAPSSEGLWMAQVRISCREISGGGGKWDALSTVSLQATAERPNVEVRPDGILDFGRLPEASLTVRTIEVVGRSGDASIPIRLIIEGERHLGHGFYFTTAGDVSDSTCESVTGPFEMICLLKGTRSVNVHLKTPSILPHEDEVQVLRTKLRIDLDSATSSVTLATVLLRAVVGVLKLYIPQDVEPIPLQPSYDLPLQNRGPIPVKVELTTEHPANVSVTPSALLLAPQQRSVVQLVYRGPESTLVAGPLKSQLNIQVQPNGPLYEMHVVGLSSSTVGTSRLRDLRCPTQLQPLLSSDTRSVFFGTVPIGQTSERTLVLQNASTSHSLTFKLYVISGGGDKNSSSRAPKQQSSPFCVYLQSAASLGQVPVATLRPDEKMSVVVTYTPKGVCDDLGAIVVKPLQDARSKAGQGQVKFTVPLGGYGGSSNVVWDGIDHKKAVTGDDNDDCDWVVNRMVSNGDFILTARNLGQRSAFVKIIPSRVPTLSADYSATSQSLPLLSVRPSRFILSDGAVQQVTVTVDLSRLPLPPFHLGLLTCDEILRQRFAVYCRNGKSSGGDPSQQRLEQLMLDDIVDDHPAATVERLPSSTSDWRLFAANLKVKWVAIVPSLFGPSGSVAKSNREEEDLSRMFMPLVAEQTFNETANSSRVCDATSPPTREHVTLKVDKDVLTFPLTTCGSSSVLKLTIRNSSLKIEKIEVLAPVAPFGVKNTSLSIKPRHYISLPVSFRPQHAGSYSSRLLLRKADNTDFIIHLIGEAVRS